MAGSIRKAVLGMLAGAAASAPLALSLGHPRSSVAIGMVIGIAYAVSQMDHSQVAKGTRHFAPTSCKASIFTAPEGKTALVEHFQWITRPESGVNIFEEIAEREEQRAG